MDRTWRELSETTYEHSLVVHSPEQLWGAMSRQDYKFAPKAGMTAIAILYYKLTRVPRHAGKSAREFHASTSILSVKRVHIFDEYVRVQQFVRIFVGIGRGRFCTAQVNRLLVARNDCLNRRFLLFAKTLEAQVVLIVGKSAGNLNGKELRRDLRIMRPSLV